MSKNILIVESFNDKYFLEALLKHLKISNIEVGTPICSIDEFECLDGGISKLEPRLQELKIRIKKEDIDHIGILLDADSDGIDGKISLINEKLKAICSDVRLEGINSFVNSDELDVKFACCITHVDETGELETLLKTIKSKDSTHADCLEHWKTCVEEAGKTIKQKDFDKFWISIYQRYDTCTNPEKKQANRKCSNEASMKKDIWDFEHRALDDLKAFLQLFQD